MKDISVSCNDGYSKINKPIFIIGTGRCGSTIFHKIFVHHPQVAWLSSLCNRYPKRYDLNRWLMKTIDIPIVGDYFIKKFSPSEAYRFWESQSKGFRRPFRDLKKNDLTNRSKSNIRNVMERMVTKKRNRLIIKITGWPRIGFLKEIFPDAKFIHVLRDGRGVTNSLIHVGFWRGWEGPHKWRWGMLNEKYQREWERYGKSFVILAAIQWKLLIESIDKASKDLDHSQFLQIKYEDLMSNPVDTFKDVTDFCELKWTNDFESKIKKFKLRDMNYKWKENFTISERTMLEDFLKDSLVKYGYE